MLLLTLTFFTLPVHSQTTKAPVAIAGSYVGDILSNLHGGIKTGSCYLGMASITIDYEPEEGQWLSGGHFFLRGASTHGAHPSQSFIGDFQVASNIEAGNHTYIQELWYSQRLGDVSVIAGLQDLNVHFAGNEYSALYLNSSFGIHPTISSNVTAPIFPLTSVGLSIIWNLSESFAFKAAVFDGSPIDFSDNPHNLKWRFNAGDGVFAVTEARLTSGIGTAKLGVYHHNHHEHLSDADVINETNYGIYGTFDRMLSGKPGEAGSVAAFVRASLSPRARNDNYWFAGAGVNLYGLMHEDGSDVLGLACAHAGLDTREDETAIELTYQLPLSGAVTLQPDIQYILHPEGTEARLPDSVTGTVRVAVNF